MMKNSWPNYITTVHHITGRALNHNTYIWKLIFQILRFWPILQNSIDFKNLDLSVNGMMMSSSFGAKIRVFKIEQLDFMPWTLIVSTTIGHTHSIKNPLCVLVVKIWNLKMDFNTGGTWRWDGQWTLMMKIYEFMIFFIRPSHLPSCLV